MGLRLNRALGNQEEENDHERHRDTQVTKVFVKHADSDLRPNRLSRKTQNQNGENSEKTGSRV